MNVKLQVSDGTPIVYSNLISVSWGQLDFTLDVAHLLPGQEMAQVRSRVVLSPQHAKRLMLVLQEQVLLYEQRFGMLGVAEPNVVYQAGGN